MKQKEPSLTELRILNAIGDEPCTMSEVSVVVEEMKTSTLYATAHRMVDMKWLKRLKRDPKLPMYQQLKLTAAGRKALEDGKARYRPVFTELFGGRSKVVRRTDAEASA